MKYDEFTRNFPNWEELSDRKHEDVRDCVMPAIVSAGITGIVWVDDDGDVSGMRIMTLTGGSHVKYAMYAWLLAKAVQLAFDLSDDDRNEIVNFAVTEKFGSVSKAGVNVACGIDGDGVLFASMARAES